MTMPRPKFCPNHPGPTGLNNPAYGQPAKPKTVVVKKPKKHAKPKPKPLPVPNRNEELRRRMEEAEEKYEAERVQGLKGGYAESITIDGDSGIIYAHGLCDGNANPTTSGTFTFFPNGSQAFAPAMIRDGTWRVGTSEKHKGMGLVLSDSAGKRKGFLPGLLPGYAPTVDGKWVQYGFINDDVTLGAFFSGEVTVTAVVRTPRGNMLPYD